MKKIPVVFLVSLLGCVLVFGMTTAPTLAHSAQARGVPGSSSSSTAHTHASSRIQRHPLSETYDCDQDSPDNYGYIACDVASNVTPCLRVHSADNINTIVECVPPGTTLHLDCTMDMASLGPSYDVLGNTYWDFVYLGSNQFGVVADAYMDTTWDPTIQGPDLSKCGAD